MPIEEELSHAAPKSRRHPKTGTKWVAKRSSASRAETCVADIVHIHSAFDTLGAVLRSEVMPGVRRTSFFLPEVVLVCRYIHYLFVMGILPLQASTIVCETSLVL